MPAVVTTAAARAAASVRVTPALNPAKPVAEAAQCPRPALQRGRRINVGVPRAAMDDAYRHSDTEGGRDPSSTTGSTQANARVRGGQVCVEDGSVVLLPTEETADQDLLAGLLASSGGTPCASALLQHFPSIGHVISAEASQLRAFGLSRRDVAVLRLLHEIACRMARAEVRSRPVLGNWQALIAYLQTAMAYQQIEQFRILFLDRKNTLIADEVQQRGTVSHTPVYPREVMKRALILNASALIVVHFVARNKMRLMCPAPLCGQAQHSRCFPRLFGARSHITGSGYSERRGGAETGRVIVVLTAARLTVGTRGAKSAFTTS